MGLDKDLDSTAPQANKNLYSAGLDPFNELANTGSVAVCFQIKDGEPVATYLGRPDHKIQFPDMLKDMLKHHPNNLVKERTDEDIRNELKAIAMFNPTVFKEFLENDYERITNKGYLNSKKKP